MNNNEFYKEEDDDSGSTGTGTKIHFRYRDSMALPPRDDVLPPAELKRLIQVHTDLHKSSVEKQKQTRKERTAAKEGKLHLSANYQQGYGHGYGQGRSNQYKKHPIADKAYFSGIDKQNLILPSEYNAETNLEKQQELDYRLENQLKNRLENRLANRPAFNPKLKPRGM